MWVRYRWHPTKFPLFSIYTGIKALCWPWPMNWNHFSSFLRSITWSPGEGGENNEYNRKDLLDLEGRIKWDEKGGSLQNCQMKAQDSQGIENACMQHNFSHWNDKFQLFWFFLSPHSSNKWRSCTARKRNRSEFREIYIEAIKLHIFTLCLACASVEYSDKCTRCGVKKTWRALEETFWATPLSASR